MWWYRNILFFLFVILAAPLEYHVHWFIGLTQKGENFVQAINEPLISGALFFYSIIVVVEAIIRIDTHPTAINRPAVKSLKVVCMLLVIPFAGFLTNINSPLGGWWIFFQWVTAVLSFAIAAIVHGYISKIEPVLRGA
jgi:hypothetical protein